jgi:hypothetical protein
MSGISGDLLSRSRHETLSHRFQPVKPTLLGEAAAAAWKATAYMTGGLLAQVCIQHALAAIKIPGDPSLHHCWPCVDALASTTSHRRSNNRAAELS